MLRSAAQRAWQSRGGHAPCALRARETTLLHVRSRPTLSLPEKHFGARCRPADTVPAGALPCTAPIPHFPYRCPCLAARRSHAMTPASATLADNGCLSTLSGLGIAKCVESDYDLDHWRGLPCALQMVMCGPLGAAPGARHKVGSCARAISRVGGSGRPFSRAADADKQVQRPYFPELPWPRLVL
eukprot:6400836-Prymnesium_polylepis.1